MINIFYCTCFVEKYISTLTHIQLNYTYTFIVLYTEFHVACVQFNYPTFPAPT